MNILITLPKHLIEYIINGKKEFLPKLMEIGKDGFFVVEKGTDDVKCWCKVDEVRETYIDNCSARLFASRLCVPVEYIEKYANGEKVYLWKIGKVIVFDSLKRASLIVDRNPQQFTYCALSHGESL